MGVATLVPCLAILLIVVVIEEFGLTIFRNVVVYAFIVVFVALLYRGFAMVDFVAALIAALVVVVINAGF